MVTCVRTSATTTGPHQGKLKIPEKSTSFKRFCVSVAGRGPDCRAAQTDYLELQALLCAIAHIRRAIFSLGLCRRRRDRDTGASDKKLYSHEKIRLQLCRPPTPKQNRLLGALPRRTSSACFRIWNSCACLWAGPSTMPVASKAKCTFRWLHHVPAPRCARWPPGGDGRRRLRGRGENHAPYGWRNHPGPCGGTERRLQFSVERSPPEKGFRSRRSAPAIASALRAGADLADGADRDVQPAPCDQTAALTLTAPEPRPSADGRTHGPGADGHHAGRRPRRNDEGCGRDAGAGDDPLQPRNGHRAGPTQTRNTGPRVLCRSQARIRAPAFAGSHPFFSRSLIRDRCRVPGEPV